MISTDLVATYSMDVNREQAEILWSLAWPGLDVSYMRDMFSIDSDTIVEATSSGAFLSSLKKQIFADDINGDIEVWIV